MQEELKRQGLSIRTISRLTGYDRKTIRKYLVQPNGVPVYAPHAQQPGKTRAVSTVFTGTHAGRSVERTRAAAGVARARLHTGEHTLLTEQRVHVPLSILQ